MHPSSGLRLAVAVGAVVTAGLAARSVDGQTTEPTPQQWREDLDALVAGLEQGHPNPYHAIERDRFHAEVDSLAARAPGLPFHAVVVQMARLLAMVGDGHTLIPILWDRNLGFNRLPIELFEAEDGLVVVAATDEHQALLGARILHIGRLSADEALEAVRPLVSFDNEYTRRTAAAYLERPRVLHALGVIGDPESTTLEIEDSGGAIRSVALSTSAAGRRPAAPAPLWLRDREDRYWFEHLPEHEAIYVQFNGADFDKEEESVAQFGERLHDYVVGESVHRVIMDIRWNDGGSRWRARHLLNTLIRIEGILGGARASRARSPGRHIITLISPSTFSAATQFALDLDLHTNTTFLGEPTGGRPNHYGEGGGFRLPNSGITVRHSSFYHQASHPRDTRAAVFPDEEIRQTVDSIRSGRDLVLEAALRDR